MNAPYNQDVLAAGEACFRAFRQLLYCERCRMSSPTRWRALFRTAPFRHGFDADMAREGHGADGRDRYTPPWLTSGLRRARMAPLARKWLQLFVGKRPEHKVTPESFYRDPNNSLLFSAAHAGSAQASPSRLGSSAACGVDDHLEPGSSGSCRASTIDRARADTGICR